MPSNSKSGVTVAEAVGVLRRLEPRAAQDLTERKVRYMAAMLGAAPGRSGATPILDRLDLVAFRLLLQLEASGISRPLAKFAAVCIAPEVRDLLARARPVSAVVVVPMGVSYPKMRRPILTSAGEARWLGLGGIHVSVRELTAGVTDAIARVRAQHPTVWQWKPVAPVIACARVQQFQAMDREAVFA